MSCAVVQSAPMNALSALNALRLAALMGLFLCVSMAQAAQPARQELLDKVRTVASETQTKCQSFLHHDADEYVECIDELLAHSKKIDATRLGIEYFGWVGALNSARISLPGAAEAADRYLRRFRQSQRKLKIDDAALCSTVPGDCTVRIARMLQDEAGPRMRQDRFDPQNAGGHRH